MAYRTEFPDYRTAHRRVVSERGKACMSPCVDCGSPADEWSYDHADENELHETRGDRLLAYSALPIHYDPRCRSCHFQFDRPAPVVSDRQEAPISDKCGTYAGWNQHQKRGSQPCVRCRMAANDYARNRRNKPKGSA